MAGNDGIVDFWQWYERRFGRKQNPVVDLALDKCEETFRRCEWDGFSYWYAVYQRERMKARRGGPPHSGK